MSPTIWFTVRYKTIAPNAALKTQGRKLCEQWDWEKTASESAIQDRAAVNEDVLIENWASELM